MISSLVKVIKMYHTVNLFVGCLLLLAASFAQNATQNSIGFPEVEEDTFSKNKDNRQPVYLPSECGANELYYPGDQADDWICDCRPSYLYHPNSDLCWAAYQRGPCAFGEYLILPRDTVIPVCVKNPCSADTYVYWNGKCERLGTVTTCAHLFPIVAALGVNATTLELGCLNLKLETRFGDENDPSKDPAAKVPCKPGSKLSVNGKCSGKK